MLAARYKIYFFQVYLYISSCQVILILESRYKIYFFQVYLTFIYTHFLVKLFLFLHPDTRFIFSIYIYYLFIPIFFPSYSYSCIQIQDLFFYAYLYFFSCQVILIQIQDLFFLGIFNIHLYLGRAASIPSLIYHTSWLSYVQSELNT